MLIAKKFRFDPNILIVQISGDWHWNKGDNTKKGMGYEITKQGPENILIMLCITWEQACGSCWNGFTLEGKSLVSNSNKNHKTSMIWLGRLQEVTEQRLGAPE